MAPGSCVAGCPPSSPTDPCLPTAAAGARPLNAGLERRWTATQTAVSRLSRGGPVSPVMVRHAHILVASLLLLLLLLLLCCRCLGGMSAADGDEYGMALGGRLGLGLARAGLAERAEVPHNSSVGPIGVHAWRNDSANIRLVKAWNDFLALTPLTREFAGAVTDTPPVALDWSVGADIPIGWKNVSDKQFRGSIKRLSGKLF